MQRLKFRSVMKLLVVTGALSALTLSSGGVATAGQAIGEKTLALASGKVVPLDAAHRSQAEDDAFRNELARLDLLGELDGATLARMGLTQVSRPVPAKPSAAAPQLRSPSAVQGCSVTNAQTSANAISLTPPTIWLAGSSSDYRLYASAKYKWTSPPAAGSTCRVKVGGPDGFALTLNKSVTNTGVTFYTCNSNNKCQYDYGWLETNSSYGAGYAFQDLAGTYLTGYSDAYAGNITYSFKSNVSACVQAYSKYGHTWNSTSVNGFSIGPWSIGIQWSSSSNYWQKSSQSGSYNC
ncbi:hypothetical protein ACFCV3_23430 [Kribbella sp. NPDC056345]|uniref:hypothetical protein n=1 Tax=Kribbella sp. NPDC056345 TaxID=3345789 RepID=UPI0035D816D5